MHEAVRVSETKLEGPLAETMEMAREILGKDFLGPSEIKTAFDIELKPKEIPPPSIEDTLIQKEIDTQKTDAEREYDANVAEMNAILDPLKARLDQNKQTQISNIQANYARLRQAQEKANARRVKLQETIGVRTGGRYTPEHTADLVQEQVNLGLQAISELNAEEADAISKINSTIDDKADAYAPHDTTYEVFNVDIGVVYSF